MKPTCFIVFVSLVLYSDGQSTASWKKLSGEAGFILHDLKFNIRPIHKANSKGIFGDLSATTIFPVNYEIHFSTAGSLVELILQTERSAIATAMLSSRFGKLGFSFSIDNLLNKKSQPPDFEIIQNSNRLAMPDINYKPEVPRFLQLTTTINF